MNPLYLLLLLAVASQFPSVRADTPKRVTPPKSLLNQLKVIPIGQEEMRDSLRVPARVELDQQRVARIGATVTGRVSEIRAVLGDEVKKGEILAMLNSTELGAAQSAYLKASSQVNLRRLAVSRARRLLESDVIAAAEVQERESMLGEAEVDLHTAEDQLRVLGMSDADVSRLARQRSIHSFSPISASLEGTVIERKVTLGQVVQPADALFTVADLSRVWVVAEIPEQQARWAREGDEASAEVAALPEEKLSGKLIFVADVVNPETRTVTVRMEVPNAQQILKPQMLATLLIRKQGVQELVVPDSAVIREDNRDHVFVEKSPGTYELVPVELGDREGKIRSVADGLKVGQRIVVDGVYHLNNERLRGELE